MSVRRLIALLAWMLLVLAGSAGVWGVIRTTGTGTTTSPEVPSTTSSLGPVPVRAHRTASPRPKPRSRPHQTTSPAPAPTNRQSASPAPTTAPKTAPASEPPPSVKTDDSVPQSREPTEVRRTWQGNAGVVVASCRGSVITFGGAQPNSGWRVEVGDRGPEHVEVHFSASGGDDAAEGEVELKARCVGGQPGFASAASSD